MQAMNEETSELLKRRWLCPQRRQRLWPVHSSRALMKPWTKGLKRSGSGRLLAA
jgi:hypothetical protein